MNPQHPESVDDAQASDEAGVELFARTTSVDRSALILATAGAVVLLDQLTKWWALERLVRGDIDVVGSLRFHLVFNRGTAFSLGGDNGPIFAVIAIVVAVAVFLYARRIEATASVVGLALVLGGAIGNVVDRVFRSGDGFLGGRVVDFVDLQWWPVFNVADAAIVCGAVLLTLLSLRSP